MGLKWASAKDPAAVLDFQVDWSAFLGEDAISSSTWAVPTGLTQDSATHDGKKTTIWLSGGTDGVSYQLTNRIVTLAGRTDERTITLKVKER